MRTKGVPVAPAPFGHPVTMRLILRVTGPSDPKLPHPHFPTVSLILTMALFLAALF